MARKLIFPEHAQTTLPAGTLARIDALLPGSTASVQLRKIILEWLELGRDRSVKPLAGSEANP